MTESDPVSWREKWDAIVRILKYSPLEFVGIVGLSLLAAIFEGFGLSFIVPIVQFAQGANSSIDSTLMQYFIDVYRFLGVPFTLETVIVGVGVVLTCRFSLSFAVKWLQASFQTYYVRHLQSDAFQGALVAEAGYYDREGSDDILNAIITQTKNSGRVTKYLVRLVQQGFLCVVYVGLALYIAPLLTLVSGLFLGVLTVGLRTVVAAGYSIGDTVAEANERVQQTVQAGVQGNRDVKIFSLARNLYGEFREAVDSHASAQIRLRRNQSALDNAQQLVTALTLFVLIYIAIDVVNLSLSEVGLFLFAMFRLSPRVSTLNNIMYRLEGELPHLVRTHDFIDTLSDYAEPDTGSRSAPDTIETVSFQDVSFGYDDESVLEDVSFSFDRKEFVAFAGESGAGKSTIAALLMRLYEPDSGEIRANDTPISEFDRTEWRRNVSMVRQHPYVFDETLRYNLTIGKRDASDEEIERACEIARITEFLDDLDEGLDTELGDDGVRLSGGQRQRVALARAILSDSEILLLDEATSELDSTLERKIHDDLERLEGDRTLVVIAHNLSTVRNADKIFVIDEGEIAEEGTHEELVGHGGRYAELYSTR